MFREKERIVTYYIDLGAHHDYQVYHPIRDKGSRIPGFKGSSDEFEPFLILTSLSGKRP